MIVKEYFVLQVKSVSMSNINSSIDFYNVLDELFDEYNCGRIGVYKDGDFIGRVEEYSEDVYDFLGDDYNIDELFVKLKEMNVTLKTANEQDINNLFPS